MADHTITISNALSPVGVGPVQLWNTMLWNEQWGSSADVIEDINVAPDMADLTLTPAIQGVDVTHIIDGNTLSRQGCDPHYYKRHHVHRGPVFYP